MLKKILIILILILTIFSINIYAMTLDLKLEANKKQISKGERVTVILNLSQGMQAADFSLNFNPKKLEYIESDISNEFINVQDGKINVSWFSDNDTDKTEISFVFKAKENGKAVINTEIKEFATGKLEIPSDYSNDKIIIYIGKSNNLIYIIGGVVILFFIISLIFIKTKKNR